MPEESTPPPWPPLATDITTSPARGRQHAGSPGAEFPAALRGYDRDAVDEYVRSVNQQLADLEANRSPDAAVRRALERVGEEVSGILSQAHETAGQLTVDARREAEEKLEAAQREALAKLGAAEHEAEELTAGAERRLKELDAETDRIWAERHQIVEDARALAGQLLALADAASERFPEAEEEPERDEVPLDSDSDREPGIDETAVMPPFGDERS